MTSAAEAIVRRYYEAWASQERDVVDKLTGADFHFTSPLDNGIDRATFFARCWPNSERIQSFDLEHVIVHGNIVIVIYEQTTKDQHRFRNCEALTVYGGQVQSVEVYFGWNLPHKAPAGGFLDE